MLAFAYGYAAVYIPVYGYIHLSEQLDILSMADHYVHCLCLAAMKRGRAHLSLLVFDHTRDNLLIKIYHFIWCWNVEKHAPANINTMRTLGESIATNPHSTCSSTRFTPVLIKLIWRLNLSGRRKLKQHKIAGHFKITLFKSENHLWNNMKLWNVFKISGYV